MLIGRSGMRLITGPYKYVRNPMAVAGVLQTIGVGVWIGSWTAILAAFAGAILWNVAIRPSEEADLIDRFGESYLAYERNVGCWLPNLAGDSRK